MIASLNRYQIDNVLYSQVIGRLGCSNDQKVYIVPLIYAYNGEFIYCHTAEGRKVEYMRQNRNVCFEVEQIQDMAHWQSVILWGKYEELENEKREEGLNLLTSRVQPLMSSETVRPKHSLDQVSKGIKDSRRSIVFRVRVDEITGKYEKV